MSALGYNPMLYRVAAFVLSAAVAGAAGVMQTYLNRFVNPEDLGALVSARGLLIAVIAGASLWSVPAAAIALTVAEDLLSSQTERWLGAVGLIYIVVALLPSGKDQMAAVRQAVQRTTGATAAAAVPGRGEGVTEALVLERVTKHIGGVHINRDVTVRMQRGERRALIGPNGAGKTTLLNIAAGLMAPSSGRVLMQGVDVTRMPSHRRARRGMARTFQITTLLPGLTVAENLALSVQSENPQRSNPLRRWRALREVWERVDELLAQTGLADVRDLPVGRLPYGQQRKLEIIVAVARPASVILLDEPGAGLSSADAEELLSLVFGLGPDLTVMFIDHDIELAFRLATQVTALHLGEVVGEGTPAQVRASGVLDEIYLGARRA